MLDSWSTFRDDYQNGNSYDFGKYDKCLGIKNSQYCLVQYFYKKKEVISVPPNTTGFNPGWQDLNKRFGGAICIPESCTPEDVKDIMEMMFDGSDLTYATDYDQSYYCQLSEKKHKFGYIHVIFM